jgi:hypothetical protein
VKKQLYDSPSRFTEGDINSCIYLLRAGRWENFDFASVKKAAKTSVPLSICLHVTINTLKNAKLAVVNGRSRPTNGGNRRLDGTRRYNVWRDASLLVLMVVVPLQGDCSFSKIFRRHFV